MVRHKLMMDESLTMTTNNLFVEFNMLVWMQGEEGAVRLLHGRSP